MTNGLQMKRIKIKTPEEVSQQANEVDNGLHHKELPRLMLWAYIWENFKKEFKIIFKL